MNQQLAEKEARDFFRADFVKNNGLKINERYYPDLETYRRSEKIGYKTLINALVWSPIDYDLAVHPDKLQRR